MDSLEHIEPSQNLTHLSKSQAISIKYQNLIVMRLMGVTHKKMGEKTGLSPEYVRRLFMRGGRLYKEFEAAKQVAAQMGTEEAMTILFSNLPDVARAMVSSAKEVGVPTGVMAGKIIFDHTFGKPVERVKINANVSYGTFAEWAKAQALAEEQKPNGQGETNRIQEQSE